MFPLSRIFTILSLYILDGLNRRNLSWIVHEVSFFLSLRL